MRNILLGTLAGLAIGTVSALAYSHYLGDGKLLADLQAQLDTANANLAKAAQDKKLLTNETSGVSDQIDHLVASNEELKRQLDDAKNAPATTVAAPPINPAMLASVMMGMMRGGGFQSQQRMFLLQSRLKLTPDQAAKIKAAMDADAKQRQDIGRQLFRNGGKIDPQAAANANTLDQTLASVLTPQQQTQYQQVQADEKASRADTAATTQVNQMAPLLQLNDSQKDQVAGALYQIQIAAPDPTSLMTNPNAASVIASQAQATQDALAKVLTPDQLALYQQQGQSLSQFGFAGRGHPGAGNAAAGAPAAPATTAPAQ
jgi:Spy/CpxP family protein refolding chaperone